MKHHSRKISGRSLFQRFAIVMISAIAPGACATPDTSVESPPGQSAATAKSSGANASPDSDGDGVTDDMDQCKGTARGAPVNTKGCALDTDSDQVADHMDHCQGTPAGVKVDKRGCGFDDDGDGVPDYRDACASTPLTVNVGGDGCEWDSDNDGVADSKDLCAGTPPGPPVEPMGCLVVEVITLEGVYFKTGSDQLSDSAKKLLQSIARTLKNNPKMRIEIAGHTDNTGSGEVNKDLSVRRADSTRRQLVDLGVSASTLTVNGYADSKPVASNDSNEGRAANRRVELRIVQID